MNQGYEHREQLGPRAAGRPVLDYLAQRHRHSTLEQWQERIARGEVFLDGAAAEIGSVARAGAWLVWRRPPWIEPAVPLTFAVLYRDQHLLAVAKPSGLPSVPAGGFLEHTLLALVRRSFGAAAPAHRLGRGTSGLVLFGRTPLARARLAAAWRSGNLRKEYRALVVGHPAAGAFTVDTRIGPVRHPLLGTVAAASEAGREARSHVRVLERRETTSLVEVRIETGRPHQIRIHLACAGHPLAGDPLYLAGGIPTDALPGEGGYHLHAHRLSLRHPLTGAAVVLECGPPPLLRDAAGADEVSQPAD